MKFLIILFLALTSVSAEFNRHKEGRIVNGMNAAKGQIPFQAALTTNLGSFCGAIIYKKCFITAAHCLRRVKSGSVIFGTTKLDSYTHYQNFSLPQIKIHSDWRNNDIGVIQMKEKLPTSPFVKSANLSCSNSCKANETVVVSGWGKTSNDSSVSNDLKYTSLPIADIETCNTFYKTDFPECILCASTLNNSSTCNGDSGGPAVSFTTKKVCGLTSFGTRSCKIKAPVGFTDVFCYCDWIESLCN